MTESTRLKDKLIDISINNFTNSESLRRLIHSKNKQFWTKNSHESDFFEVAVDTRPQISN